MLQEKENAKEQANAKGTFLKGCTRQWTEAQTLEGGRGWVEGGGVGVRFALVQRTKINSASSLLWTWPTYSLCAYFICKMG